MFPVACAVTVRLHRVIKKLNIVALLHGHRVGLTPPMCMTLTFEVIASVDRNVGLVSWI